MSAVVAAAALSFASTHGVRLRRALPARRGLLCTGTGQSV